MSSLTSQLCTRYIHLSGEILHFVVGLRNALRVEGVGLDDVGSCFEIAFVYVGDDIRTCEAQHVVVALHLPVGIGKASASEVGFGQSVLLNDSTHCTVENQDSFFDNMKDVGSHVCVYSKLFINLHGPVHLAPILLLLERLSLVVSLLTLAECNVHLGSSVLVDEHEGWHDGVARLLGGAFQSADLPSGEQQLSVALLFMVVVGAVEVGADAHSLDPQLTVDDGAIGIDQAGLSGSDGLDFRTREHDARRKLLNEEVFEGRLLVLYLYRTLLPDFLFCFVHADCSAT